MTKVRVFCPTCKGGKNTIWTGTLQEWKKELLKKKPPDWANYASRHHKHHGHEIMVEYPSGEILPFIGTKK